MPESSGLDKVQTELQIEWPLELARVSERPFAKNELCYIMQNLLNGKRKSTERPFLNPLHPQIFLLGQNAPATQFRNIQSAQCGPLISNSYQIQPSFPAQRIALIVNSPDCARPSLHFVFCSQLDSFSTHSYGQC